MKPAVRLLLITLMILPYGCKTAPIPDFPPISVPTGMTAAEVETAILITLIADAPFLIDTTKPTTPDEIAQILRQSALRPPDRTPRWHLKRRSQKSIEAEYRRRNFTLLLELRYDEKTIQPTIIDSTNLKQSRNRIHKAAIIWAQQFSDRVSGSLRWMKQYPAETERPEAGL
jgi:hypothetical protein